MTEGNKSERAKAMRNTSLGTGQLNLINGRMVINVLEISSERRGISFTKGKSKVELQRHKQGNEIS
jgi:hypothetical protein